MENDDISSQALEHNFWTWSAQRNPDVIPIEKAEGVYFWEPSGKRYLDFNSMVMCVQYRAWQPQRARGYDPPDSRADLRRAAHGHTRTQ